MRFKAFFYLLQTNYFKSQHEGAGHEQILELLVKRQCQLAASKPSKENFACLHNFVRLYLDCIDKAEHGKLFDMLQEMGSPKQIVLGIVTKHFRGASHNSNALLLRGL